MRTLGCLLVSPLLVVAVVTHVLSVVLPVLVGAPEHVHPLSQVAVLQVLLAELADLFGDLVVLAALVLDERLLLQRVLHVHRVRPPDAGGLASLRRVNRLRRKDVPGLRDERIHRVHLDRRLGLQLALRAVQAQFELLEHPVHFEVRLDVHPALALVNLNRRSVVEDVFVQQVRDHVRAFEVRVDQPLIALGVDFGHEELVQLLRGSV
mmetsp:Transcript_24123/g.27830  ORF Transcript_24123/g.27830 Transcript_24123/m.27830 type:complete len:208 (+) Transcript_24123:314-937(+)